MRLSFFHKLFLAFLAIGIIPLVIISFLFYGFMTDELEKNVSNQAYAAVTKISDGIDKITSEYGELVVNVLREDPQIRLALLHRNPLDTTEVDRKILSLAGRRNAWIYVINPQGNVVFPTKFSHSKDIQQYLTSGILYQAAGLKNGYVLSRTGYFNSAHERVAYSIVRSILDEKDTVIGYVIIEISKSTIIDICDNLNSNLNLNLMVLNSDAITLADLRNPKMDGATRKFDFQREIRRRLTGFFIRPVNQERSLIAFHTSSYTQFTVMGILPFEYVIAHNTTIRWITLLACLLSFVICLILAILMTRHMTHPLFVLVKSMKKVETGDLTVRVQFNRSDELGMLGHSFNRMVAQIRSLLQNTTEKQQQIRDSEIKALQAQINPHFLYNTLDSIKWLAKLRGAEDISVLATRLGKLLRSSISCKDDIVTVGDTVATLESYIEIQKIRYSDRFTAQFEVDAAIYPCRIPKLILQPLVENAIIHGLDAKIDGQGLLTIKGWREEEKLIFAICDNGVGITPEILAQITSDNTDDQKSDSIGIQNVRRRIQLYYGAEYDLQIQSEVTKGTCVTVCFPYILEESEAG